MGPSTDPSQVKFNDNPSGVFQINTLPVYVFFGSVIVLILFFLFHNQGKKQEPAQSVNRPQDVRFTQNDDSDMWFNDNKFKDVKFNKLHTAPKPLTPKEIERQTISEKEMDYKQEVIDEQYQTKLTILKLKNKSIIDKQLMEMQAEKSPLNVDVKDSSPSGSDSSSQGTGGGVLDQIQKLTSFAPQAKSTGLEPPSNADINKQDEKNAYLKDGVTDDEYLNHQKAKPKSPYEIKAGTYIPAALITGINSDLPAPIVAQVSENVYDTVTGNYLLVPQGTKLIGEYDSHLSFGQNRVEIIWTRVIFPDGSTLNLEKMPGVDIAGQGGFSDKVDAHYIRIYGNALLLSLMGAGYGILNNGSNNANTQNNAQQQIAASVGQRMSEVTNNTLEKNLNVQPTIIIRPGYQFQVAVMKDIVLDNLNGDFQNDDSAS